MTAIELKNELHQMIDNLKEDRLLDVYDYLHTEHVDVDPIDELTETQQARLEESIEQAKNGQVISNEAFKQRFTKWLTK